jgi:hypothetical protein
MNFLKERLNWLDEFIVMIYQTLVELEMESEERLIK